jgi:nucleoside-diphosphate-sugar epimerase
MVISIIIFLLNLFVLSSSFQLNRRELILKPSYLIANQFINKNKPIKTLLISCNKIGKSIISNNPHLDFTIATTKIKRLDELALLGTVELIPQMEICGDEIFKGLVRDNDVIIIADTISIFSVHTYQRTCERVFNAFKDLTDLYGMKKKIILISSSSYYGCYMNGENVDETSSIKKMDFVNSNKNWKLNNYNTALVINNAEKKIVETNSFCILRTGLICDFDDNIFLNNRKYSREVGESFINLSNTQEIANAIKWIIDNDVNGIYNFNYEAIKKKDVFKKIRWDNDMELDKDFYYSIEDNPHLPNAQRFNLKMNNRKIINRGYKFKYSNKEVLSNF